MGAGAKTLHIAILSQDFSAVAYCASVWCCSIHTYLIDSVFKDALCIVTKCLHPIPTNNLPIFSGIQSAGLYCLGATILMANCSISVPELLLHEPLIKPLDVQGDSPKC